ncbi:acetyltransferase (putative) [Pediococcus damnosus]|uniref:Acetyltransferase (Putative) n=1 Tax=Pediococcus damnosus TaxID=51663 RepID=A0A0R2HLC4_9LACO|nr:GNAT family N-acetyltransferase [Pediococcus damnosus]AMV60533.1 acetyltransferase (putative) [Pediococcus damnosus]AMV63002.1 acetyltransferase (putative) [Pediococcus damnosus]AMV64848.1 acetyltransferase (putative) [Pediococcus damnosus]AMV67111.1 acetyltransferase (putative) [Pediococcus damnosus]AMV69287.1 acetyltransferase (putative) [Pediococcus damnosus]
MKSTKNITILPATASDNSELAEIYLQSRIATFSWVKNPQSTDFIRDSKDEFILKAILDNRIVGFLSFYSQENFIHLLFIDPAYIHFGIGSQLLSAIRQLATAPVTLNCVRQNHDALAFYKTKGFKIVGKSLWKSPAYYTLMDTKKEDYPLLG